MVGSAIVRKLVNEGFQNIIVKDRSNLDLTDTKSVRDFFYGEKINYSKNVFIKPILYIPKENIIKYFNWRNKNIQQN